jgi:2'-5' RNA ligase
VRLFLAINLEPGLREAIVDAAAPLREAAPGLSWVDESRLHLTLKFLGDVDAEVANAVTATMDDVARRHRPFSMQIGEVGAFPNFRRPRVVWMGIERESRLELLHHDVELACEGHGFDIEGRAFRPHLTLARVRDRADAGELRQLTRASKKIRFEGESMVQSIDLMRSNPGSASPRYERLHAASLRHN